MSDNKENIKIITSESVTEGHPDKICDQISDGILDTMLSQDPDSHAAIECFCTNGLVVVGGEARTEHYVNVDTVVRKVLKDIGYNGPDSGFDCDSVGILSSLHAQSPEIAQGVDEAEDKEQGAGDQGIIYGFATKETPEFMPLPVVLANKLAAKLAQVRKDGTLSYLRPDGKTQVSVEYHDLVAKRVDSVIVSACHRADVSLDKVREDIMKEVVQPVLGEWIDVNTKIHINTGGAWTIGGPTADTGLTGRKIIVDTYGGFARHGGGAFSGKDASKVDRSAAYMARYVAKNVVAAGLADKCELQLAYALGLAEPLAIYIETFSTAKIKEEKIVQAIKDNFDFRPKAIIEKLQLKSPIFLKTAAYGHFGKDDLPWEKLDKKEELAKYLDE